MWRVTLHCYVFDAYYYVYLPLLMLVSFDVQVLESDAGDLVAVAELWRRLPHPWNLDAEDGCKL